MFINKQVKMKNYERKTILRNTIGNKLPKPLLMAPKKGFGPPLREWFKGNSFSEKLNSLETTPFLNNKVIREIIQMKKFGKNDYRNFILMLLILNKK
ncbi:MAG TPA: asparagine synthase-related protein [Hanamia sp.]